MVLENRSYQPLTFHPLHPRLAIATILLGDYANGWLCHFGLKCSTFTTVNCGTSGRTPCTPYGNLQYTSVHEGNVLASRTLGGFSFNMLFSNLAVSSFWLDVCMTIGSCVGPFLNKYGLRVMLLIMLVICLNGTMLLEQPANSLLEYYPRFRTLMDMLRQIAGPHAVPWL